MPWEKELNYFCPWPVDGFRDRWQYCRKQFAAPENAELLARVNEWYENFTKPKKSAKHYRSLFARPQGTIAGDLTPSCAVLNSDAIARYKRAAPNAKIIYLLRDPVDRMWSFIRMRYAAQIPGMSSKQLRQLLYRENRKDTKLVERHNKYLSNIDRWEKHFGEVHVLFLEQLESDPEAFFREICRIIGISTVTDFLGNQLHKRIFEGPVIPIPPEFRKFLAKRYYPSIKALYMRYPNAYVNGWLDRHQ